MTKARVIAFYLPQFHPVPINDKYWGKGYTEWTNVAKAKPLYRGHYQPQIPADLGFYDLRVPEVSVEQAKLAAEAGIEGFCYWYYWFGRGKKILEMPIERMLASGSPDYPFCIGWANHDWSNKTWQKNSAHTKDITFLKQEYLGEEDYRLFFDTVLPMFKDHRYITVDNKPLFYIFNPSEIPDLHHFIVLWQRFAKDAGLQGIYFVARVDASGKAKIYRDEAFINGARERYNDVLNLGVDAINSYAFRRAEVLATGYPKKLYRAIRRKITGYALNKHDYQAVMSHLYMPEDREENIFPTITPRRDRTPRSGSGFGSLVYADSTPEKFAQAAYEAVSLVDKKSPEHRIVFLDSWNEWGEGAYMEPDLKYGSKYLEALKCVVEG